MIRETLPTKTFTIALHQFDVEDIEAKFHLLYCISYVHKFTCCFLETKTYRLISGHGKGRK